MTFHLLLFSCSYLQIAECKKKKKLKSQKETENVFIAVLVAKLAQFFGFSWFSWFLVAILYKLFKEKKNLFMRIIEKKIVLLLLLLYFFSFTRAYCSVWRCVFLFFSLIHTRSFASWLSLSFGGFHLLHAFMLLRIKSIFRK